MYVHHQAKVVYLAGPRSASIATASALETVGFRCIGNRRGLIGNNFHHAPLWDGRSPVTSETRDQWFVITTIRNHWDVAISWLFKRQRDLKIRPHWGVADFRKWLPANWVGPDRMWHLHADGADHLWRYETLERDMAKTLTSLGLSVPALHKENVTEVRGGEDYRRFYTPQTRRYIGERFAAEIERFGYTYA